MKILSFFCWDMSWLAAFDKKYSHYSRIKLLKNKICHGTRQDPTKNELINDITCYRENNPIFSPLINNALNKSKYYILVIIESQPIRKGKDARKREVQIKWLILKMCHQANDSYRLPESYVDNDKYHINWPKNKMCHQVNESLRQTVNYNYVGSVNYLIGVRLHRQAASRLNAAEAFLSQQAALEQTALTAQITEDMSGFTC